MSVPTIRVGRPAKTRKNDRRPSDGLFFRAAVLAICGAAAVVSFFSLSVARSERETPGGVFASSHPADAAIAVSASGTDEAAVRSSANAGDGSVWSYIEGVMRRLFGDEGE